MKRVFKRKSYRVVVITYIFKIDSNDVYGILLHTTILKKSLGLKYSKFLRMVNNYISLTSHSQYSLEIRVFYKDFYYYKPSSDKKAFTKALQLSNSFFKKSNREVKFESKDENEVKLKFKQYIQYYVKRKMKPIHEIKSKDIQKYVY